MAAKKKRIPISVYEEPTFRLLDHLRKGEAWDSFLLTLAKNYTYSPHASGKEESAVSPDLPVLPPAQTNPPALPVEIAKLPPPPPRSIIPPPTVKKEEVDRYCVNAGGFVLIATVCKACRERTTKEYYKCQIDRSRK